MSDITEETRDAERNEADTTGHADRPPTDDEAKMAEKHDDVDDSVAEAYEEAIETGANVKGEGEI